jgi:hypothetical protein
MAIRHDQPSCEMLLLLLLGAYGGGAGASDGVSD